MVVQEQVQYVTLHNNLRGPYSAIVNVASNSHGVSAVVGVN